MIELKLTPWHFEEILSKGCSLDHIYILSLLKKTGLVMDNLKVENICKTLIRKGLLTDSYKVTKEGDELLSFLSTEEGVKLVKKKPSDDVFNRWWNAYPSNDTFDYKGKHFPGTRSLKAKKDDCKLKLHKILNEGEYTIDEMIKAIELEVHQKKENSIKTGQNKLSFQQNSMTYLNQYTYESYIELIRKGEKKEETQTFKGVDI